MLPIDKPRDTLGPNEKIMKLGIIGVGAVGSSIDMAAASRAQVREIVLVNGNRARAKAAATDMHYGLAISSIVTIRDGDHADLADVRSSVSVPSHHNPSSAAFTTDIAESNFRYGHEPVDREKRF